MKTTLNTLRLARLLEDGLAIDGYELADAAAAELRRLHDAHDWQYKMAGERLRRIEKLEARITQLEAALRQALDALNDTAYRLEQSRIWGGMEWSYHPMHPVKYLPVRDKVREAATAAKQVLGES